MKVEKKRREQREENKERRGAIGTVSYLVEAQ